jgi:beta-glucanase (GH16 family)
MTINPKNLAGTAHLTFADEFSGKLSLWNGSTGTWATTFAYDSSTVNGDTLAGNGEQEWYINSNYAPTAALRPWHNAGGYLHIEAQKVGAAMQSLINGYKYVSGEVNTYHSFSQEYGFFEMRAKLPAGQGFWPAFWLMPENGQWPPELDIMEMLGNDPTTIYTTAHYGKNNNSHSLGSTVANTSSAFHNYGIDWEADKITWYFDDKPIYSIATPADMHQPMYMIMNLALGGYWPGNVNSSTDLSHQMQVDWVRVYAAGAGSTTGAGGATSVVKAPDDSGATLTAVSGRSTTFVASHGPDTLVGGTGSDTFKFPSIPWSAGHVKNFAPGSDALDLRPLFKAAGYAGSHPVTDHHLIFQGDGHGDTKVWFDPHPGDDYPFLITTLDGISPSKLTTHDWIWH